MSAPDYCEPVEGWRVWGVVGDAGALRLESLFYDTTWQPRECLAAVCRHRSLSLRLPWRSRRERHPAPEEACNCGIHASSSPSPVLSYLEGLAPHEHWRVLGTVALWGDVVECERGWRASYAYPSRLYVTNALPSWHDVPADSDPAEIALALTAYEVPIELVTWDGARLDRLHPLAA